MAKKKMAKIKWGTNLQLSELAKDFFILLLLKSIFLLLFINGRQCMAFITGEIIGLASFCILFWTLTLPFQEKSRKKIILVLFLEVFKLAIILLALFYLCTKIKFNPNWLAFGLCLSQPALHLIFLKKSLQQKKILKINS
ncbi:hypothetical protein ACFL35_00350 [Candidatus Riflebacteria bacterium]